MSRHAKNKAEQEESTNKNGNGGIMTSTKLLPSKETLD